MQDMIKTEKEKVAKLGLSCNCEYECNNDGGKPGIVSINKNNLSLIG
jgi:hypothetical protein